MSRRAKSRETYSTFYPETYSNRYDVLKGRVTMDAQDVVDMLAGDARALSMFHAALESIGPECRAYVRMIAELRDGERIENGRPVRCDHAAGDVEGRCVDCGAEVLAEALAEVEA